MKNNETKQIYFTKKEIAYYFGCHKRTVERYMEKGLPYIKINGLVRIKKSDFRKFIREYRVN